MQNKNGKKKNRSSVEIDDKKIKNGEKMSGHRGCFKQPNK